MPDVASATAASTGPIDTPWGLTPTEFSHYDEQGYLLLRGMFDPTEVASALAAVRQALAGGAETIAWHPSFTDRAHTVRIRDAISQCPELAEVLDHPRLVGPLRSLLGDSVQILGTEIFVRSCQDEPLEDWHTDGGESLQRILLAPGSRSLQLKCQVFLTDVSEPDSGNFLLVPGSHRRLPEPTGSCYLDDMHAGHARGELPDGAITVLAEPGDALLFPYSLWHAVAANHRRPRVTLIFRYGQLWHRPNDYLRQPPEVLAPMSPRLRRMFGDLGSDPHPLDFYKPQDQAAVMSGRA